MKQYPFIIVPVLFLVLQLAGLQAFSQSIKGQSLKMHSFNLTKNKKQQPGLSQKSIVGLVDFNSSPESEPERKASYDFLNALKDYRGEYIPIRMIRPKAIRKIPVLWIRSYDPSASGNSGKNQKTSQVLRSYVEQGGNLLLSGEAVHFLFESGLESILPKDSLKTCRDKGYGRSLGFHAFREHPIFNGLNGGAYIFKPPQNISVPVTGYFGDQVPLNGKVVAVDWDYIRLRENSKLVTEYQSGKGKIIAVGAYMNFADSNLNRDHLELFTRNIFDYLNGKFENQAKYYWDYAQAEVVNCENMKQITDRIIFIPPESSPWKIEPDPLSLDRRYATSNFYDLAGERILAMGSETGGIEETWAHPFMAFRDYEVGLRFSNKDTILWLNDERPEIQVNPAYFLREYKFSRAYLKEILVVDPLDPAGVIHYEYRGVYPAELIIRFKSNLRRMWPYSEKATGSICHLWDMDLNAFMLSDLSGDMNLFLGGNRSPIAYQSGQYSGFKYNYGEGNFMGVPSVQAEVGCLLQYQLKMNDNLDIVFVTSSEGYLSAFNRYEMVIREPNKILNNALSSANELFTNSLIITTPDQNFNLGYRWALAGSNRFRVNTPGMGKSLVAGYSTTGRGWDGGHKINGRPGYGWYFGRDGQWSGFAFLDYGDFLTVKNELEFFNKYQDLHGKIFHEATTSGFIHYDAADATPLYIVLAGKYFRHSNDTAFLRNTWPNILKAIHFCFSTDTDGDHLPENTNVGHGWVEGGELYGSHVTLYLAGCWSAALKEAANMARFIGDSSQARFEKEASEVRKIINADFWNDSLHFFAYGKNLDGTYRTEQTILPSVPFYFKLADPEKAKLVLGQYAGNAFSTNWGTRIIRDDSPFFKPTGYHYGSVWPLFTGWTSLAEYSYGNYLQGFSHLMNNLNVYKNWGLGFVEEVMNGAVYQPSGVCPHQCWSETMVLQPIIEGMLGLEIFAQENRIILSPRLPQDWDSLTVRNIRMADKRIGFSFHHVSGKYIYDLTLQYGSSIKMDFMPVLPAGTQVKSVKIDGHDSPFTFSKTDQNVTIFLKVDLKKSCQVVVETEKGISVFPLVPEPKPGYSAAGTRILSAKLLENEYQIELEGVPGMDQTLKICLNGWQIDRINGAEIIRVYEPYAELSVSFRKSKKPYEHKLVSIFLK